MELQELNDAQQERMCDLCENIYETNRSRCEGCRCENAIELLKDDIHQKELEAKKRENDIDYMLLYGIAKLFSMQSTRFIGEIKNQKDSHFFKQSVKYVDKYLAAVESHIKTPEAKKADDLLVDDMNNWIIDFKKHLLEL